MAAAKSEIVRNFDFEVAARRLLASNRTEALKCAYDIKERIELVHTCEYPSFLQWLFPAFRHVLMRTPVSLNHANALEGKLRHAVLETLNRLPNNEVLRPYAVELLRLATDVLATDNEENALTCLRIVFDLHKNYRPALEAEVQSFLDLVQQIYYKLPESVSKAFVVPICGGSSTQKQQCAIVKHDDAASKSNTHEKLVTSPSAIATSQMFTTTSLGDSPFKASCLPQGMHSFRVLTECPLIVMLLFQLYPKFIQNNIPVLTPLMMGGLALSVPRAAVTLQRERYKELVACQVKTLSFLTYLLRGFSDLMQPYDDAISKAVIALMLACPTEAITTRKELLVATRHILATDFRRGFVKYVDILLNEHVLIGSNQRNNQLLRPLAFSTLADLVHHVRAKLTLTQLARVVNLFARNLHDASLPVTVQATSVRLMLNLVDFIFHNTDTNRTPGRKLLDHILHALATKFDTLRFVIFHCVMQQNADGPRRGSCVGGMDCGADESFTRKTRSVRALWSDYLPRLRHTCEPDRHNINSNFDDVKALIQTLILGMKTIMWCVSHYKDRTEQTCASNAPDSSQRETVQESPACQSCLAPSEVGAISNFFRWGLLSCRLFVDVGCISMSEVKDIVEHFSSTVTVLTGHDIRMVLHANLHLLFDTLIGSPPLLAITQLLLANANVSADFADLLLSFLVRKVSELARKSSVLSRKEARIKDACVCEEQSQRPCTYVLREPTAAAVVMSAAHFPSQARALVLLRLFKIVLGSAALFPSNEKILVGRLGTLSLWCVHLAAAAHNPIPYLVLLRLLFRSTFSTYTSATILRPAFVSEFDVTMPKLYTLLIELTMHAAEWPAVQHLYTELCLLAAAGRYTHFMPHLLPLLTRALLAGITDLASLALRTLEQCIDDIGVDAIRIAGMRRPLVYAALLRAVCMHLKPGPCALGTPALRVLGKLGGCNRKCASLSATTSNIYDIDIGCELQSLGVATKSDQRPVSHSTSQSASRIPVKFLRTPTSLVCQCKWKYSGTSESCSPDSTPHSAPVKINSVSRIGYDFDFDLQGCVSDVRELFFSLLDGIPSGDVCMSSRCPRLSFRQSLVSRHRDLCFRFFAGVLCGLLISREAHSGSASQVGNCDSTSVRFVSLRLSYDFGVMSEHMRSLTFLLICACAFSVSDEANSLLRALCLHFAASSGADCYHQFHNQTGHLTPQQSALRSSHESGSTTAGLGQCLQDDDSSRAVIFTYVQGPMVAALIDSLSSGSLPISRQAACVVKAILKSFCDSCCQRSVSRRADFISSVALGCSNSLNSVNRCSSQALQAICHGLTRLLPSFGHEWAGEQKEHLLVSLFATLRDACPRGTLLLFDSIAQAALSLLDSCYQTHMLASPPAHLHRVAQKALFFLSDEYGPVRLLAQCVLERVETLAKFTSYIRIKRLSSRTFLHQSVTSPVCGQAIGVYDAVCYLLRTTPPNTSSLKTAGDIVAAGLESATALVMSYSNSESHREHSHERFGTGCCTCSCFVSSRSFLLLGRSGLQAWSLFVLAVLRTLSAYVSATQGLARIKMRALSSSAEYSRARSVCQHHIPDSTRDAAIKLSLKVMMHPATEINLAARSSLQQVLAWAPLVNRKSVAVLMSTMLNELTEPMTNCSRLRGLLDLASLPVLRKVQADNLIYCILQRLHDISDAKSDKNCLSVTDSIQLAAKLVHAAGCLTSSRGAHGGFLSVNNVVDALVNSVIQIEKNIVPEELKSWLQDNCQSTYVQMDYVDSFRVSCFHQKAQHLEYICRNALASPLRTSLAFFLARHPFSAMTFFLEPHNMGNPACAALLQGILALDTAAELRMRLSSHDGMNAVMVSAFSLVTPRLISTRGSSSILASIDTTDIRIAFTQVSNFLHGGSVKSSVLSESAVEASEIVSSSSHPCFEAHVNSLACVNCTLYGLQLLLVMHALEDTSLYRQHSFVRSLRHLWRKYHGRVAVEGFLQPDLLTKPSNVMARPSHDFGGADDNKHQENKSSHQAEALLLAQCLISVMHTQYGNVPVLFELLSAFFWPSSSRNDYSFLCDVYQNNSNRDLCHGYNQAILVICLRLVRDNSIHSQYKTLAIRLIVIPVLITTIDRGPSHLMVSTEALEHESVDNHVKHLQVDDDYDDGALHLFVHFTLQAGSDCLSYTESLRVELLKLTTVLIENFSTRLLEHRKELIKFAWGHLKTEDSLARQWAYVNVCRFIATYETPPKIILQVYVALLRTFQPESRELVRVALDILLPVLPQRLPTADLTKAVKWTKKIMYEEGHTLAQLVHMWHLLVRHPSIFYDYRAQFVPHMINSLNRLGLPPNCPVENRQLAVSLAELALMWGVLRDRPTVATMEDHDADSVAVTRPSQDKVSSHCSLFDHARPEQPVKCSEVQRQHSTICAEGGESFLSKSMVEMIVNFLVRLAIFASDNKELPVQQLAPRCLSLLRVALASWPAANIRFSYFEKLIATSSIRAETPAVPPPYSAELLATCLEIMLATLNHGSNTNTFLTDNINKAQELICPCFDLDHASLQGKLTAVLSRVASLHPPGKCASFTWVLYYERVKTLIETRLSAHLQGVTPTPLRGEPRITSGPSAAPKVHDDSRKVEKFSTMHHESAVGDCKLAHLIRVIHAISEVAPQFASNFAHSILALSHCLLPAVQGSSGGHPTQATPTIALLFSWKAAEHSDTCENNINVKATAFKLCISFMQRIVNARLAPSLRRQFVALVFVCVERCRSIHVLLHVSEVIRDWLMTKDSPLTVQERQAFFSRLSRVDHLPELSSLALFSQSHTLIQRIDRVVPKVATRRGTSSYGKHAGLLVPPRYVQTMAYGLLAPHAGIRADCQARSMLHLASTIDRQVLDLLGLDWSLLSGRFWLLIVVEVALQSVDWAGPLQISAAAHGQYEPSLAIIKTLNHDAEHLVSYRILTHHCISLTNVLKPLAELAHASMPLAQRLWEQLLPLVLSSIAPSDQLSWQSILCDTLINQLTACQCMSTSNTEMLASSRLPSLEIFARDLLPKKDLRCLTRFSCCGYLDGIRRHQGIQLVPRAIFRTSQLWPSEGITKHLSRLLNLSSRFNNRHGSLAAIERVVTSLHASSSIGTGMPSKLMRALLMTFEDLADHDSHASVLATYTHRFSRVALTMARYGQISSAQYVWFNCIESLTRSKSRFFSAPIELSTGPSTRTFYAETVCSQWLTCARNLAQWGLVLRTLSGNPLVIRCQRAVEMDAASKSHLWDRVRQVTEGAVVTSHQCNSVCETREILLQARLAVVDKNFELVDRLCTKCIHSALQLWARLPQVNVGNSTHDLLLHIFHELVEVHESGQLVNKVCQHVNVQKLTENSALLRTWRLRLPNLFDNLTLWDDIMRWRHYVFNMVCEHTRSRGLTDLSHPLHDVPWIITSTSRVARKQRLEEAAKSKLAMLDCEKLVMHVDINDTFYKLREQILSFAPRVAGSSVLRCDADALCLQKRKARRGLNLIANVEVKPYNSEQEAELLRLQGELCSLAGQVGRAHEAFSKSARVPHVHGRAWFDWASLCNSQLHTGLHGQLQRLLSIELASNNKKSIISVTQQQLRKFAFVCYLAAIEFGCGYAFVAGVARLLWLLRTDITGHLGSVLQKRSTAIPSSHWIPWISQLLSWLGVHNTAGIWCVLARLARFVPQSLYFHLRSLRLAVMEHSSHSVHCQTKETLGLQEYSTEGATSGTPSKVRGSPNVIERLESISTSYRWHHTHIVAQMDTLSEEVTRCFRPGKRTRMLYLLHTLHILVQDCHDRPQSMHSICVEALQNIQVQHQEELTAGQSPHLSPDDLWSMVDVQSIWNETMSMDKLIVVLCRLCHYLQQRARDTDGFLATLSPMLARLSVRIQDESVAGSLLPLHSTADSRFQARGSQDWQCYSRFLLVPGQYCTVVGTMPERFQILVQMQPFVKLAVQGGLVSHTVGFTSNEGHVYCLTPMFTWRADALTQERSCHVVSVLDHVMSHCLLAQRQRLRTPPKIEVLIGPHTQLVESSVGTTTLGSVYEFQSRLRKNTVSKSYFVAKGLRIIAATSQQHSTVYPQMVDCASNAFYNYVCETTVPTDVFMNHISYVTNDHEAIWNYRRVFSRSLALVSFVDYLLSPTYRSPAHLAICQKTGCVTLGSIQPRSYGARTLTNSVPPFRLTRNLERALYPFLIGAMFVPSFGATATAMSADLEQPDGAVEPTLHLSVSEEDGKFIRKGSWCEILHLSRCYVNRITAVSPLCTSRSHSHSCDLESNTWSLLSSAHDPSILGALKTSWQPWL